MAYDNNLRGALFKNEEKRPDKKDPDYRGNVEVDNVEYWLDAWLEKSKQGKTYMSLKLNPKQPKQASAKVASKSAPADQPFDDDIPF
jgi:uncharacterized protein (DUF736 family)